MAKGTKTLYVVEGSSEYWDNVKDLIEALDNGNEGIGSGTKVSSYVLSENFVYKTALVPDKK